MVVLQEYCLWRKNFAIQRSDWKKHRFARLLKVNMEYHIRELHSIVTTYVLM